MFDYQPSFSPERNLLVAVLRRALFDYCNGSVVERTAAEEWLLEEDTESCFSYQWICVQLGIDPETILSRLRTGRVLTGSPLSLAM